MVRSLDWYINPLAGLYPAIPAEIWQRLPQADDGLNDVIVSGSAHLQTQIVSRCAGESSRHYGYRVYASPAASVYRYRLS